MGGALGLDLMTLLALGTARGIDPDILSRLLTAADSGARDGLLRDHSHGRD